jgi:hypothetical protein
MKQRVDGKRLWLQGRLLTDGARRRRDLSPHRESPIARAAPTTELPNSGSKMHGCGG